MTTIREIDVVKSTEEASPMQPDEVALAAAGRAALTDVQNALLSERDVLQIIRGYQTDTPRLECTEFSLSAACHTLLLLLLKHTYPPQ